jgi:hypothetical protein
VTNLHFSNLQKVMTAIVDAAAELPFEGINAADIIPLLLALLPSDCINGKVFWKSYKKWDSLTTDQRNKSSQFWKNNISQEVRDRIAAQARASIATDNAEEATRKLFYTFIFIFCYEQYF